jgi:hypothetical protein
VQPLRLPRLLVLVVATWALLGCQATVRIGIDAHHDGSGTVTVTATLDRDGAASLPDLAKQLRTDDLQKAGWTVAGPRPVGNGGLEIQVSKPFRNPAEAVAVLGELSGAFQGFTVDQRHGLLSTTTTFGGVVDLTCGLRCLGDPQLQQLLGGADLGIDPAKLQQQTGFVLDRTLHFEVAVRLPGTVRSSNAPTKAGNSATWQPAWGAKVDLVATSRSWDATRLRLLALGVLVLLALVAIVIRRGVVVRRRRRSLHFRR